MIGGVMDEVKQGEDGRAPRIGRRELMKLGAGIGAGAVAATLDGRLAAAQENEPVRNDTRPVVPPGQPAPADEWRPHTGVGYTYTANRLDDNGPMDDVTRKIVAFTHGFGAAQMTPEVVRSINRTMVDSLAAMVAGFEEEAVRVCAKATRISPPGPMKCTVLGYGIETTPEYGAFANSAMVRMVDFNDTPHNSNLIPAALAVGEALHSSGRAVMEAVAVGYEIMTVPFVGESIAPAMAAGKLMGLDEDRLANAVTIALTPHVALNKGVGAMSMWKGCRSAEAIKCGVWAALLAREGMTGPPQPFEGRGGVWYEKRRMGRDFTLPAQERLAIQRGVNKRYPSDQITQQTLGLMPQIRQWTRPDEVQSIEYYMTFFDWEEVGDAPKWDPHNRDTADHSIVYVIARNMISGESYLDAFTPEKLPFNDPVVRELMAKITLSPVKEWRGNGTARIVITKKSGETRYWDTHDGDRLNEDMSRFPQLSDGDITAKFKRACDFRKVDRAQQERALAAWWDLGKLDDIGTAIATMARFGDPRPF